MMRQELTTRTMVETGFPSVRYEELFSQLTQPLVYIYITKPPGRVLPTRKGARRFFLLRTIAIPADGVHGKSTLYFPTSNEVLNPIAFILRLI